MLATIKPSSSCDALSLHRNHGRWSISPASGIRRLDSDSRAESSAGHPGLRVQSSRYAVCSRRLPNGFAFLCSSCCVCACACAFNTGKEREAHCGISEDTKEYKGQNKDPHSLATHRQPEVNNGDLLPELICLSSTHAHAHTQCMTHTAQIFCNVF